MAWFYFYCFGIGVDGLLKVSLCLKCIAKVVESIKIFWLMLYRFAAGINCIAEFA
jgi:hypothetical protein